jgi:hypothetical protein
MCRTGRCEQ